jgi:hypothetical protein
MFVSSNPEDPVALLVKLLEATWVSDRLKG